MRDDYRLLTNLSILFIAVLMFSIELAKEQRMWLFPHSPKTPPGTTATFCALRSFSANSSEGRPVG